MFNTPFPRPNYRTYVFIALIIGASIAFTLIVFQPFGTSTFKHDYKYPILAGYGLTATVSIILYYYLSLFYINKRREPKWNIILECLDLLLSALFGFFCTYLYYITIFDFNFKLSGLFYFLGIALSVSLLPLIGMFLYFYNEYKGTKRSSIQFKQNKSNQEITLKGTNKDDIIHTSEQSILYVKAEDNYVIITLLNSENLLERHMIRSTLKQITAQLKKEIFYQCHRSYLVNIDGVVEIQGNKNNSMFLMKNTNKKVPISRAYVDQMRSIFANQN